MTTDRDAVARAIVDARRRRSVLEVYPGLRPVDLAEAYDIQDRTLALWQRRVGGWKVGRIGGADVDRLGTDRLAGPIFSDSIVDAADGDRPTMRTFLGGFAAAEGEFLLRLNARGGPLPRTDAETLDWVDAVHIGIEIASSPYPSINDDGPCVTISDHGNNAGLVVGKPIARAQWDGLTTIEVAAFVDDACVGRKTAATMLDGPLGAVRFLLGNLRARAIDATAGIWISSGAVTGVHPVAPGQVFRATFADIGEVACTIAG